VTKSTDAIIEEWVAMLGLTERNILQGLTDQQCRVFVQWAILGRPEREIAKEVLGHCKSKSAASVKHIIRSCQVRIVAEILGEIENMEEYLADRPGLVDKLKDLMDRPEE